MWVEFTRYKQKGYVFCRKIFFWGLMVDPTTVGFSIMYQFVIEMVQTCPFIKWSAIQVMT